jgi:hypothetical protein
MRADVDSGIPGTYASRGLPLSTTERSETLASRRLIASHDLLTIRDIASAGGGGQSA